MTQQTRAAKRTGKGKPERKRTVSRKPPPQSKLSADRLKRLGDGLRLGLNKDLAAQYAGIAPTTLYDWQAKGREDPSGPYGKVVEAIENAEAQCAAACMAQIAKAAREGTWQAAGWIMERRFGYRAQHAVSGPDGGPVKLSSDYDLERLKHDPEAREALAALAARLERDSGDSGT